MGEDLIQIVDGAVAEAARKSGAWLVCRPGCTSCCMGPFAISPLDARRLREGLAELETADPARAGRVRARAHSYVERFPLAGLLAEGEADEEPCPALDPQTGLCDLYAARPLTCRLFGPPVPSGDGLGVCELCYRGASDEEIAACALEIDPAALEEEELARSGERGQTIVAFCLAGRAC